MKQLITALAFLTCAASLAAQETTDELVITAMPDYEADRFINARGPLTIQLSRAPRADDGRVVVVVGAHDLTSLFTRTDTKLLFRGNGFTLPRGESDVKVFLVSPDGWREIGRFPLRVLTRGGFEHASIDPALSLNNKGQLAEGHSGSANPSERPTYQDGSAALGLQTSHTRSAWTVQLQLNTVGVTNEKEALRFGTKGDDAPRFDLSDYVLRVQRSGAELSAGHVSFGSNRHLISGFGSRGVTAALNRGPVSLALGALNGNSVVGWDNVFGLQNHEHRMTAATLALELMPKRPGAIHLDLSALDGSVLPNPGFSQGGIIDAETSSGFGVQFATSTSSQRLRAAGGVTRSRFEAGNDPQLAGEFAVVGGRPQSRSARYAEASAGLLQDAALAGIATSLTATARHERVDPLYRSLASYTQSDVERNAFDLSGNIGALDIQLGHNRSSDNLDEIASILTTLTRVSGGTLSVPLARLLRITQNATLLPTLSLGRQRTHQHGAALPTNADFQAGHVPDQVSIVDDAALQWQGARWRLGYRFNRSMQDNRQAGRENSDLNTRTNNVALGFIARSNLDLQVEAGIERQENQEFAQVNRLRRVAFGGNWRPDALTAIDAVVTTTHGEDASASSKAIATDAHFGIARGIRIWRTADQSAPGQLFLRMARRSNSLTHLGDPLLAPPSQNGALWSASSGITLRLF